MKQVNDVIAAYGVYPYRVDQVSARLFQISDGKNQYALKQSNMTKKQLYMWEHVYNQAYSHQLPSILPVYLTQQSNLYYMDDEQTVFYLSPWVEGHSSDYQRMLENTYRAMGQIHAKTKQHHSIESAAVIEQFTNYMQECTKMNELLLNHVSYFEKSRYMSPVELQVCTQYHGMIQVLTKINEHVQYVIDELKSRNEWNTSLCHGNLDIKHILQSQQTYIINWESALYANAVADLSVFFKNQVRYYDQKPQQLTDSFETYMRTNKLTENEMHLLAIYLLHPHPYIELVEKYSRKLSSESMINQVKALQYIFRQLVLGLHWSEYIQEISAETSDEG